MLTDRLSTPVRVSRYSSALVPNFEDVERQLRDRLDALGPPVRGELLRTLMLPDYDRARRIGDFWVEPRSRTFAEMLIDCEESPHTRGVLIGMLREEELK